MLDWIVEIDSAIFVFLNCTIANSFFDSVMPIATDHWFLRGVFAVIVLGLMIFGKKRGRIAAIACIVTVALADQLSAQLLKPMVGRIRPCHTIQPLHLLVNCSQGLSFPSSHAANSVAMAVYLSYQYPRAMWYLIGFAGLVSFSRIAVGVHYPFDVLVGAIVGAFSGIVVVLTQRWLSTKYPSFRSS